MFIKKPLLATGIFGSTLILIALIGNYYQVEAGSAKKELEGSWKVRTTIKSAEPLPFSPYEGMVTYIPGGGLIETKYYLSGFVSTGHGSWAFAKHGHFDVTFTRLVRDSTGQVYATEKVQEMVTITGPDTYTSTRKAAYIGLDGRFMFVSGEETSEATRIQVEPIE